MKGAFIGNRYEILEKVGAGGMAIVYKARCRLLNRYVAVKVLRPEFQNDEEFLKRFDIEAQAAASLSHPNIVSIFDVGKHDNMHYIVMEFIEGIPLNEYLAEKGALPIFEALEFSQQIASALCHAHAKKIIHRDIKPHNIIMTENRTLKVTDFGLARAVSSSTTVAGSGAIGSVHYASPEQSRGGFTDERSDIYSLGIMMYEMFTGKLPFDADTPVGVAMQHLQKTPAPPRSIKEDIPEIVENIILKAMEKDARARYAAIEELYHDLKLVKSSSGRHKVDTEKFKTKKLPALDVDVPEIVPEAQKTEVKKAEKPKNKKGDALAITLAIITAVVIMIGLGIVAAKVFFPSGVQKEKVPNLVGKNIEEAMESVDENQFVIITSKSVYSETEEEGVIISQEPEGGKRIEIPGEILVVVSRGSGIFVVGDYRDRNYDEVADELNKKSIDYEKIEDYDEDIPKGHIVRQVPSVGTRMSADDKVTLYVSLGSKVNKVKVPGITGKTESDAMIVLYEKGLVPGDIDRKESKEEKGTVISQSIPEGEEVDEKTEVNFVVSLGSTDNSFSLPLTLPKDGRETVMVRVMVDGGVQYQKKHNTSEGSISVKLQGEGEKQVDVYYDDVLQNPITINFQ
jgi:serine/threonine protein kinase